MIQIYTTSWCPYCQAAKRLLQSKNIPYEEIDIEARGISRAKLVELTGGRSVPQIIVDGESIGGYDNLVKLDSAGKLQAT
ncbi:MAG: glutaredoxin [FCB group bacterium]|nr:glutaredoxin [FCB group bacterium]